MRERESRQGAVRAWERGTEPAGEMEAREENECVKRQRGGNPVLRDIPKESVVDGGELTHPRRGL